MKGVLRVHHKVLVLVQDWIIKKGCQVCFKVKVDDLNSILMTFQKDGVLTRTKCGESKDTLKKAHLCVIFGSIGDKCVSFGLGMGSPVHYALKGVQRCTNVSKNAKKRNLNLLVVVEWLSGWFEVLPIRHR